MSEASSELMLDVEHTVAPTPVDPRSLHANDQSALRKMRALLGDEIVDGILAQGREAVHHRLVAFDGYETSFAKHVRDQVSIPAPAPQVVVAPSPKSGPKPLKVNVKMFQGLQGENLAFWFREVDIALAAALVVNETQKVAFALSHLQGAARE